MTEPVETPATVRVGGPGSLRILVVGVATLVLAISAAAAMAGSSPPPADGGSSLRGATSQGGAIGPGPADADGFVGLAAALGQGEGADGGAPNHPGRGAHDGRGLHRITVSAKDGSTLSLKTEDGWTRQITVASDTTITRAGVTIGLGDINVGDTIAFRQTRNDDGTWKIVEIRVVVPQLAGDVTAATSSSLTLRLRDGSTRTVILNGSTKYFLGPRAASAQDVKVGSSVVVAGTTSGDTFTALSVTVRLQVLAGEVTAKTADTITVRSRDGATTTVKVDGQTTYRVPGKDNATLADVTVGLQIGVQGIRNADNTFSASVVTAGPRLDRGPGRRIPGGIRVPGQPNSQATPAPTNPTNAS